jgi:TetR/AcrR family transcriptional regulator, fatty acid metabolism regulator protein
VFAEKGFFQSTISMISREAEVADGTIYLYFRSKEDLYIRLFRYRTEQVFDRFGEAVDKASGARAKLKSLIRSHLEEFQKDRDMAVTYQLETHSHNRLAEDPIREMSKRYMDIITEILELGQQEGWIRKDLYLGLVKRLIIGAVDEVINTWIHAEGKYDLRSMADPLVDLLINGIASTPAADDPDGVDDKS